MIGQDPTGSLRPTGRLAAFSHPMRDCQSVSLECGWTCVAPSHPPSLLAEKRNGGEEQRMIVGIDVHKNYCEAASIDEDGRLIKRWRFRNQNEAIEEFLPNLPAGTRVAMESCSYFYPLYNQLEREGFQVSVAHPLKVKLIAESRNKNDRVDANILAQLLRMNYLPTSYPG